MLLQPASCLFFVRAVVSVLKYRIRINVSHITCRLYFLFSFYLIFKTTIIWSNRILSLKYLRSMPLGYKDIVIRKSEFVANTHFLSSDPPFIYLWTHSFYSLWPYINLRFCYSLKFDSLQKRFFFLSYKFNYGMSYSHQYSLNHFLATTIVCKGLISETVNQKNEQIL